jgi:pimeloyl-ACP methyl ester carboxylesterase
MKRSLVIIICICASIGLSCLLNISTPFPMRTLDYQKTREPGRDILAVFLPGYLSKPEDFKKEGFIDLLKKYHPEADCLVADASIGYYMKEIMPERLLMDVIRPARLKGYRRICIVGISMGGTGAVWFMRDNPQEVDSAILIAPFIADKKIITEVENAGGLLRWSPSGPIIPKDYQRSLLMWLKQYAGTAEKLPVLSLGYGESDRFLKSDRFLTEIIPAERVYTAPGVHDWKTWRIIFQKIMQNGKPL